MNYPRDLFPVGPVIMGLALLCGCAVGAIRWGEPSDAAGALGLATALEIVVACWLGPIVASPVFNVIYGQAKRTIKYVESLNLPTGTPHRLPFRIAVVKNLILTAFVLSMLLMTLGPAVMVAGACALVIHLGSGVHSTPITLMIAIGGGSALILGSSLVWTFFRWMEWRFQVIVGERKSREPEGRALIRTIRTARRAQRGLTHATALIYA